MTTPEFAKIVRENISPSIWKTPKDSIGWINGIVFKDEAINQHSTQICLGIACENLIRSLLIFKYTEKNVPVEILGHGTETLTLEKARELSSNANSLKATNAIYKRGHSRKPKGDLVKKHVCKIYTRLPSDKIVADLSALMDRKNTEGRNRHVWSQDDLVKEANLILEKYPLDAIKDENVWCIVVDIILHKDNEGVWYVIEVKLSGDCDSRKTPAVIIYSMLLPLVGLGICPKKTILGIVQDTKGMNKNNKWKGPFAKFIDNSVYLVEEKFGELFLPTGVTWSNLKMEIENALGPKK